MLVQPNLWASRMMLRPTKPLTTCLRASWLGMMILLSERAGEAVLCSLGSFHMYALTLPHWASQGSMHGACFFPYPIFDRVSRTPLPYLHSSLSA